MQPDPEPPPETPTPPDDDAARAARMHRLHVGASLTSLVVLVVGAGLVILLGYPFFGVVLVVLAVFAAVDLTWVLRRNARSR